MRLEFDLIGRFCSSRWRQFPDATRTAAAGEYDAHAATTATATGARDEHSGDGDASAIHARGDAAAANERGAATEPVCGARGNAQHGGPAASRSNAAPNGHTTTTATAAAATTAQHGPAAAAAQSTLPPTILIISAPCQKQMSQLPFIDQVHASLSFCKIYCAVCARDWAAQTTCRFIQVQYLILKASRPAAAA